MPLTSEDRPERLRFDCYGALIQLDEGSKDTAARVIGANRADADPDAIVEPYDQHESELERNVVFKLLHPMAPASPTDPISGGSQAMVRPHDPEDPDGTAPVSGANQARVPSQLAGMGAGRRSREDVALQPQLLVLTPQPRQIVTLRRAQDAVGDHGGFPFPAALLTAGLRDPVADRLG